MASWAAISRPTQNIVDVIRLCTSFIFTTSFRRAGRRGVGCCPPFESISQERDAQQANAAMLKKLFADAGLPVMISNTHIVPLMVGDPVKAKKDQRYLAC